MRSSVLALCGIALGGAVLPRPAHAQTPFAPAPTRAPRVEGRITITRTNNIGNDGTPVSNADATFARSPVWGTPIASDGPCSLYAHAATEGLSAGTISITGTLRPVTLDESRDARGVTYQHAVPVPNPMFVDGATIDIETSGGVDVPAFTASVSAPPELTGYRPPTSLARTGYTATWIPRAGREIMIVVAAGRSRRFGGVLLMCRVPDTGVFTVPASSFALIPPAFDRVLVVVARVARTFQAVGDAWVEIDAMSAVGSGPLQLAPTERARGETTPRAYLSLAFGGGGISRNGDVPPQAGVSWQIQLGQRLRHGLHIVEDASFLVASSDSSTSEVHSSMGAGVGWTPFEPRPAYLQVPSPQVPIPLFPGEYFDLRAWYLTAVIGADLRDRVTQTSLTQSTESQAWSPMASLAVGLLAIQGHDWSLGTELREQLAYFDGHLQLGWMLLYAIRVN